MSGGLIGCFAAFALETDEMAGTKQGPSGDQVIHWERHQVGTKSGTKSGTKFGPSRDKVKRAVKGPNGPVCSCIPCTAIGFEVAV